MGVCGRNLEGFSMTDEFANRIANNAYTSEIANAMSMLKDMYDGAIAVGFTKNEALTLIAAVLTNGGTK